MAKKRKKTKLNYATWVVGSLILIALVVIIYLAITGKFSSQSSTYVSETSISDLINNPSTVGSCSLDISPARIQSGQQATGTLIDGKNTYCEVFVNDGTGWKLLWKGYTDDNGMVINTETIDLVGTFDFIAICDTNKNDKFDTNDCVTNQETLVVDPIPSSDDGWDVGDIVDDTHSGSGSLNGDDGKSWKFDVSNWDIDSEGYILGVRIYRGWDYVNPDNTACQDNPGTVDFTFFDSTGYRWGESPRDPVPYGLATELCPVFYQKDQNGVPIPWFFEIVNTKPGCPITYQWDMEIYICEES